MLRKLLESKGFNLDEIEFEAIIQITTEDIKFNRIGFKKKTTMDEVVSIAEKSIIALRRCV